MAKFVSTNTWCKDQCIKESKPDRGVGNDLQNLGDMDAASFATPQVSGSFSELTEKNETDVKQDFENRHDINDNDISVALVLDVSCSGRKGTNTNDEIGNDNLQCDLIILPNIPVIEELHTLSCTNKYMIKSDKMYEKGFFRERITLNPCDMENVIMLPFKAARLTTALNQCVNVKNDRSEDNKTHEFHYDKFILNLANCRSISKNGGGSEFSFDSSDNGVFALPTLLIGSGMSRIFHESNSVEVWDWNVNLRLVEKKYNPPPTEVPLTLAPQSRIVDVDAEIDNENFVISEDNNNNSHGVSNFYQVSNMSEISRYEKKSSKLRAENIPQLLNSSDQGTYSDGLTPNQGEKSDCMDARTIQTMINKEQNSVNFYMNIISSLSLVIFLVFIHAAYCAIFPRSLDRNKETRMNARRS